MNRRSFLRLLGGMVVAAGMPGFVPRLSPFACPTLSEIVNATIDARSRHIADLVYANNPLLSMVRDSR